MYHFVLVHMKLNVRKILRASNLEGFLEAPEEFLISEEIVDVSNNAYRCYKIY